MELQELPEQKLAEVLPLIEPKALAVLLARTPQSSLHTFLHAVSFDSVPARSDLITHLTQYRTDTTQLTNSKVQPSASEMNSSNGCDPGSIDTTTRILRPLRLLCR